MKTIHKEKIYDVYAFICNCKTKAVPLHAMEAPVGGGGEEELAALTHS
jgi:hypothetical protein